MEIQIWKVEEEEKQKKDGEKGERERGKISKGRIFEQVNLCEQR